MRADDLAALTLDLYKIDAIKLGEFKLKSGVISPIYLDLRMIISYPKILNKITSIIWEQAESLQFDVICGVPYTAIPFASIIAANNDISMLMCRKEAKDYGTKKMIDGFFKAGQACLLIEDIITSGSSIMETVAKIETTGLVVKDIIAVIDRGQNAKNLLKKQGYNVHAIFTLDKILENLYQENKINHNAYIQITSFIKNNQFKG